MQSNEFEGQPSSQFRKSGQI